MNLSDNQITVLMRNLIRAKHFDEMMVRRMMQGRLIGFYHPAEGHLAPGVGACSFLNRDDNLNPHHRGHGMPHMLAKNIAMHSYLAEHTGKSTGCCQGRSAFHFSYPDDKVYQMSGFIGHNFAPSVGWAWAAKRRGEGQVVMNCSGDGSYGQGRAHEAMLMAANWQLPMVFLCENNGMSIFASASEMHPTEHVSSLAAGFDMPSAVVDGQDVFAVAEAALDAIERARRGAGPTFIEAKCLRFREHDIGTPDLEGWEGRTEDALTQMREREPVRIAADKVLAMGTLTQAQLDALHEEALAEVAEVEAFADDSPIARPAVEALQAAVFAESSS